MTNKKHAAIENHMAQHNNGSKLGWTLLGWMNLVAVALLILVFTGARPTLGQILGGTALFLLVTILVVWAALRRR